MSLRIRVIRLTGLLANRETVLDNIIGSIIQNILTRFSPGLATVYSSNGLFRITVNNIFFFPLTFFLAILLGGGTISWIVAFFITSIPVQYASQGKGHLQVAKASDVFPNSSIASTSPVSAPPTTLTDNIIECPKCRGQGFIDNAGIPIECTMCNATGKLRVRRTQKQIPSIRSAKGSGLMSQVPVPKRIMWMLIYILIGGMLLAISNISGEFKSYVALAGIGIILLGLFTFKGKKPNIPVVKTA